MPHECNEFYEPVESSLLCKLDQLINKRLFLEYFLTIFVY